jgi:hypothetical protein
VGYTASYFYHDKVLKTIGYVNKHTFLIRSSFLPIIVLQGTHCDLLNASCEPQSEEISSLKI